MTKSRRLQELRPCDFTRTAAPGPVVTQWQTALDANTLGLPRPAISGIRLYERYFYLSQ